MTAMAFVAALWTGCEDDKGGETPPPPPPETALSNLNGNVALPEIESARLDYRPELSTARTDTYFLTLSVSGFDASLRTGRGVRFELSVDKGGSPFGRYLIGDGGEPCVPGALDGEEQRVHSWYVDASGQTVVEAPLCSGLLDLTKVLGKKPGNTYYQVSFTAYDDQSPAYSVNGKFSGDLTVSLPGSGSEEPAVTYVYAGVSGYSQEEGYTTWAIDFDNESFTKHLGFMSINADPGIAFEEGIPAGRYVIAEDDEPGTITWPTYDVLVADLSMIFLESGTVDVSRDGDRYTVVVDATDEYGDPFRADFEGQFYYENVTEKSSVGPVEAYAVWYGAKEGTTYYLGRQRLSDDGRCCGQLLLRQHSAFRFADRLGPSLYRRFARRYFPRSGFPQRRRHMGRRGSRLYLVPYGVFQRDSCRLQADRRRSDHYARSGELHDFFRRSRNVGRSDGAFRKL